MAVVYMARQLSLSPLVALKVLRTELTDSAVPFERLKRQAKTTALVHDLDSDQGQLLPQAYRIPIQNLAKNLEQGPICTKGLQKIMSLQTELTWRNQKMDKLYLTYRALAKDPNRSDNKGGGRAN